MFATAQRYAAASAAYNALFTVRCAFATPVRPVGRMLPRRMSVLHTWRYAATP